MSKLPQYSDILDAASVLKGKAVHTPLISNAICVGVVKDKNGDDTINYNGTGDEDGDTLSDWFECCVLGTDPCDDDTDGDKVDDNVDADPLDKNVQ